MTPPGAPPILAALDAEFGTEIAGLVAGVMALDAATDSAQPAEAGGADAMVAAASGDARILAIKLADRLHNMRTLQYLPQATQVDNQADAGNPGACCPHPAAGRDLSRAGEPGLRHAAAIRSRRREASGRVLAV